MKNFEVKKIERERREASIEKVDIDDSEAKK